MHLPLLQQRSQSVHVLLFAFFPHPELVGPVSSSPAKTADSAAIFLSASRIPSLGRLLGVASVLGLFASPALLPCFGRSPCAAWCSCSCFGSLAAQHVCLQLSAGTFGDLPLLFSIHLLADRIRVTPKLSN